MTTPKLTQQELAVAAKPVRKVLPAVPTLTVDEVRAMRASGRRQGDQIAEEFASLRAVTEEHLKMRLE